MMRRISIACFAAALIAGAASGSGCVALEGERILARDLAQGVPAFSALPPDTEMGYAPVPGARRIYHTAELGRLAARYHIALTANAETCIERAMEPLDAERVREAMRRTLGDADARIEIVELSRYPVPRGEIQFVRSALPAGAATSVLWRGCVRYAGERRFVIWARVKILVRSTRVVAAENLLAGHAIEARQLRLEELETFPSSQPGVQTIDQIAGRIPRHRIAAGAAIAVNLLDEPREVERGDVVRVEVQSGATRLKLEGRAESGGRRGDAIPVRNLTSGKSFSARVAARDQVVLATGLPLTAKDRQK